MIIKTEEIPPPIPVAGDSVGDTMFVIHLLRQEKARQERIEKVGWYHNIQRTGVGKIGQLSKRYIPN